MTKDEIDRGMARHKRAGALAEQQVREEQDSVIAMARLVATCDVEVSELRYCVRKLDAAIARAADVRKERAAFVRACQEARWGHG
jgi:hypothetical protein